MSKYLYILVLVTGLFFSNQIQSQTYLTIIGTQHYPTDKVNSNTLYKELQKIRPDIILMEYDSANMDKKGNFLIQSNENEQVAVKRYLKEYSVIVRPFDFEGRNRFYSQNQTFKKEQDFFSVRDSLFSNGLLDSISNAIFQEFLQVNNILNVLANETLYDLNNKTSMSVTKLRQDLNYNKLLIMCDRNDQLSRYKEFWKQNGEFWIFRNKQMIENILNYCNEFKGKKIVVLTGFYHKYFLHEGLEKVALERGIIMKEFWEY